MPNRIIKESICYSDDLDRLKPFEEIVFYRLIVRADDYGRLDARPNFLKSVLFATRNGITEKSIQDAVTQLATVGLVKLYEVEGKPFLMLPKWYLHQRIRTSRPKYPAPVEKTGENAPENTFAAGCGELPQNAAIIQSNPNPIQSESESESQSESNARGRAQERERAFESFWAAYPKRMNKKLARRAWIRAEVSLDTVLAAIERQKHSTLWTQEGGRFIKSPDKWLSGGCWEDEPQNYSAHGKTLTEQQYAQRDYKDDPLQGWRGEMEADKHGK